MVQFALATSRFKRIKIYHDKVYHADAVFGGLFHMRLGGTQAEQPAVDFRMQSFDASVHHFRKAGIVAYLGYGYAFFGEKFRRAASGKDCIAVMVCQFFRKFNNACFIAYGY